MKSKATRNWNQGTAGFSLVELLVVVALFTLLMMMVFGSLRFGGRAWEGVADTQVELQDLRDARAWLRRALERAVPRIDIDPRSSAGTLAFEGAPASLSFLAPAPRALAPGGLATFELYLAGDDDAQRRLEVRVRPGARRKEDVETHATILLDGISGMSLSYFGPPREGGEPVWQDEWTGRNVLPALVRVRLVFAEGARSWPDLVIHPLLDADATCRFDALTRACAGRSLR